MAFFYDIADDLDDEDNYKKYNLDQYERPEDEDEPAEEISDMVMVYKLENFDIKMETYVKNLKVAGLVVTQATSRLIPDHNAVLIKAPDDILQHYSKLYGYDLSKDNPNWVWVESLTCCRDWRTELTHPTGEDKELLRRMIVAVSRLRPTTFTHAERVMIVNKVMVNNQYTHPNGKLYYGYDTLKVEVFPLHEFTWRWTPSGRLHDRQLLYKYWADLSCILKVQPIFMIEKYFSTEIAFFFLYVGFFNKMLIVLSLAGVACFAIGLYELTTTLEVLEFCDYRVPICPLCSNFNICPSEKIEEYCYTKLFALLFDNTGSAIFALFTSLWSVIYMIMWRRKEATMALRWNVRRMQFDESIRPEFRKHAKIMKISKFTQKQTIDIKLSEKLEAYFLSYISIAVIIMCSICLMFLTAFYKYLVHFLRYYIPNVTELELFITASAAFIYYMLVLFVFVPFIKPLAEYLNVIECHRTQQSYECSLIYKHCLLSLPPYYGVLIYLSLFKGKFFTYPTDATRWTVAGAIPADTCNPAGCMVDVTVQLIVLMVCDTIRMVGKAVYVMYLKFFHREYFTLEKQKFAKAERWEKDFHKHPNKRIQLTESYVDLMISYGIITWFAAIFPLAPVFALLRHLVQLRFEAYEYLKTNRRIIGEKVANIHCWNNILLVITLLGIVSSGIVITFSSTITHRFVYAYLHGWTLQGYVNNSFSKFDTRKYSRISGVVLPKTGKIPDVCYYRGYKIDMKNKDNFMENNYYWITLVVQVGFMLIYENIVFFVAGIIFLLLPNTPEDVKMRYRDEEMEIREKRIEILNNRYLKQNRRQTRKKD